MAEDTSEFAKSIDNFSRRLYSCMVDLKPDANLICSPISVQTCAGMLRMGVEDGSEIAQELDAGLNLSSNNFQQIANAFNKFLTSYQQSPILHMANKIYIKLGYPTRQEFNEIITQNFYSESEEIDFSNGSSAADTINHWVESKTNNLIQNLVSSNVCTDLTRLVLVNAIHFKGEWAIKFDAEATANEDFHLDQNKKAKVSMMNATNNYAYADLKDLDAKALQLAYKDSNLYMLIILPNKLSDLKKLEQKLQTTPLSEICRQLTKEKVIVKLPKFKAEYEKELTPVFLHLGIKRIFANEAQFDKMLQSNESLNVSEILHKAFIEVNEEGTEAAAATAIVVMLRSLPPPEIQPKIFHATHPFYFTIHDANYCPLFVGNFKATETVNEVCCSSSSCTRSSP